jgi:hypothetical protein
VLRKKLPAVFEKWKNWLSSPHSEIFGYACPFRKVNQTDEILLISKEKL